MDPSLADQDALDLFEVSHRELTNVLNPFGMFNLRNEHVTEDQIGLKPAF